MNTFNPRELPPLQPLDRYNQDLMAAVHPEDWVAPTPQACYDLVVIGGGPAGLVAAAGAAGLGAKVALVEAQLMGGDCLNVGCVPSKCFITSARAMGQLQRYAALGIGIDRPQVNFGQVMERLRRIRSQMSAVDSVERFQGLGVDVFLGTGSFCSGDRVAVGEHRLRFKKAVIATGARAAIPTIPGLDTAGYFTNETIFSLTDCPPRLAVLGGGPIGCELAQAFQRLGSQVVLCHKHDRLLNRDDEDAAAILANRLRQEGVQVLLGTEIEQIDRVGAERRIHYRPRSQSEPLSSQSSAPQEILQGTIAVDAILVCVGRLPNIERLNLEAAGVAVDAQGIRVNAYLQTTNPRIYAAGDVCLAQKFTHVADAAARLVLKNALFSPWGLGRSAWTDLVIPWCTYTSPEIAQVGLTAKAAAAAGIAIQTFTIPLIHNDRALTTGETEGFVKIHIRQGSDRIVGATIVAESAGDLISEVTLAIVQGIGLGSIASVIHPYPTHSELIRKAADAYRRTLLTPRSAALLKALIKLA